MTSKRMQEYAYEILDGIHNFKGICEYKFANINHNRKKCMEFLDCFKDIPGLKLDGPENLVDNSVLEVLNYRNNLALELRYLLNWVELDEAAESVDLAKTLNDCAKNLLFVRYFTFEKGDDLDPQKMQIDGNISCFPSNDLVVSNFYSAGAQDILRGKILFKASVEVQDRTEYLVNNNLEDLRYK